MGVSNEFEQYAWLSVQVDQYYSAVRIYARQHDKLAAAAGALPSKLQLSSEAIAEMGEPVAKFIIASGSAFNYMNALGIFNKSAYPQLGRLPDDMIRFGFYTCLNFQWSIFEEFVIKSIISLAERGLLSATVSKKVTSLQRLTGQFLKYIEDGNVFGQSPFITHMPKSGWIPDIQEYTFSDLDEIRKARNEIAHAPLSDNYPVDERMYETNMWVLRKFAENIDAACQIVISNA